MAIKEGIFLKKRYGQHFLKERWVVDKMLQSVTLTPDSSVFEIGGGAGFLTQAILSNDIARLWVFEIDPEWAQYLSSKYKDKKLTVHLQNILDLDFKVFEEHKPWTLLANLPYQITFPILYMLQKNMHLLKEGVIMVQEEVAQKIVKTTGRDYGYSSLYFQYYFEWKLLDKIPPTAFNPPPKVDSRLLYFKPKFERTHIKDEEQFWKFIKIAFKAPRRTLKNNLASSHYDLSQISEQTLLLRAQQMTMQDFLYIWEKIKGKEL
jgi:16S rRNA (adenine1518-N6/adenine1519-N6)-dimethyltransferase